MSKADVEIAGTPYWNKSTIADLETGEGTIQNEIKVGAVKWQCSLEG
ncbi:hypothetical protein [Neobacillus sp. DY30]|nr:hypothetical protein [Neobacillus sp. DY30]WHY00378.1 hypothetical protein QNH29_28295 [Neobacillus sp. DY30]